MHAISARVFVACFTSIALLCSDAAAGVAGTTGFLSGSIVDERTGQGIPDEVVTVEGPSAKSTVRTDAKGRYSFVSLPPDTYVVAAEREGYYTVKQTNVAVTSDQLIVVILRSARR